MADKDMEEQVMNPLQIDELVRMRQEQLMRLAGRGRPLTRRSRPALAWVLRARSRASGRASMTEAR